MDDPAVCFDVGGVPVEVTASPQYLRFATERIGEIESTETASITMTLTPVAPDRPDRAPDQEFEEVDAWFDGAEVHMQIGNAVAVISEAAIEIGGSIDNDVDYKSIDLMVQFGIAAVVAAPDRIMVHGAVIARSNSALLLVGKSGMGKSTAATAALINGWDLLTDDLAVAQPGLGVVSGVARRPRVPADIAGQYGVEGVAERGKRGRVILPAETLSLGPRRLVGLVVVCHGDDGGLERLEPGDLHAIDDAFAVPPFRPLVRRQLAASAALVSIPTFRLSHAADETTRVDRAAELLERAHQLALAEEPGA